MKFNLLPKKRRETPYRSHLSCSGEKTPCYCQLKKSTPFALLQYLTVTAIYWGTTYGSGTTTT